jgi:hypothetical protein
MQILCIQHTALFTTLGKTSGRDVDKLQLIRDAGFELTDKYGLPVLSGVCWGAAGLRVCQQLS